MFRILNLLLAILLTVAVAGSTGCDLGTYQKRLDEHRSGMKKTAPDADSDTDDDSSNEDSSDSDPFE